MDIEQYKTYEHQIHERVQRQLKNIHDINPIEALTLAMSYARTFNCMIAIASDSEAEYRTKLIEWHALCLREGLSARNAHAKQAPCHTMP
jgi:hypothetical protein